MNAWIRRCFCVVVLLGSLGCSNSQRKQGRTLSVTSEPKQPVNFDCPEEFGYYPHPSDCTQYYVCVFGGALLESCTGGLMYSHELQTCDWPRNVGCGGLGDVSHGGGVTVSVQPAARVPEQRIRYSVPSQQSQPAAVVTSRGQSRQLQHSHAQDIIAKQQQQQQQLYAEADDALPPAEEIENDRQQRVYRGQPSTVGQVQRDRDGLRHTNAIPSSGRSEKIGVISFGTHQQQSQPQQQPQQQAVSHYRYKTLYFDDTLTTNDLTSKSRRKRQIRRRLPSFDLVSSGDSSISWQTRHAPHNSYQAIKHPYQNRENTMELQPPPIRFKLNNPSQQHQLEYSAILSRDPATNDQSEFQPFISNPVAYKVHPIGGSLPLKTSPYIVPKAIKQPTSLYQYFNFNNNKPDNLRTTNAQKNQQSENYSYFNLGTMVTTPVSPAYAPSNQATVTQAYPQPNVDQIQYYKAFRPITPQTTTYETVPVTETYQVEKQNDNNKNQENIQSDQPSEAEEEHENNEEGTEDDSIKPEFPSPPPFFLRSHNKYENIENPFADPNFDFDKFISKLRGNNNSNQNTKQSSTNLKFQSLSAQNDSKEKSIHVKTSPNIDLRTPVAFSSPSTKKKVSTEPPHDEDYYYYDDSEEESAKPTKNYIQNTNLIKSNNRDKIVSPTIKKTALQLHTSNYNVKKPISSNSHALTTNVTKPKQNNNDDKQQKIKPPIDVNEDDEYYEYYDDDDEDSTKQEVTTSKKLITNYTNNASKINSNILNTTGNISPKIPQNHRNRDAVITTHNKSQNLNQKRNKITEASTKKEPIVDATRFTGTTSRITTIKFPKLRLVTTTVRPHRDRYNTSRNTTKNSSRLEESTPAHAVASSQSTSSGKTLYNGSQQYDPAQYDPYYTLYEDDVELYRDVDYTQQQQQQQQQQTQQQYPSRGHTSTQHTYRGTPAPISVSVQSAAPEETVPSRNTAYYNTQPQDVYQSAAQDYQEDNYNTQVDDQTNYRQSSRQPSRGDRNDLNYFMETYTKTPAIRTSKTTTTTTTPRPIPVQKQTVVSSRSPIIATANQTRPQSIIITLSATPGQKSIPTESTSTTTAPIVTENTNELNPSTTSKTPVRLISLSTGFNLRQTDNTQTEMRPSTYKPQFVQSPSTTDSHTSSDSESEKSIITRPAPFSLSKLPNSDMKSVIFRLSTRLSTTSASNTSEASDQTLPLLVNSRSTENPNKREITTNPKFTQKTPVTTDSDASHIIIPTTYSPSKTLLASLLPKHTISKGETENFHGHSGEENESIIKTKKLDEYSSTEKLVAILPKKTIIINTGVNKQNHQTKSLTIENPVLDSLPATSEKSVKTLIRKTPIKPESSLPAYRERSSAERKIISKIHIRYTNPEKINNLASTPSTLDTSFSSEDYSNSQESSSEFSKPFLNFYNHQKPITAHYITTDLTTSQRPLTLSPTISIERKVTSPRTTTSADVDSLNSESESKQFRSKFSLESGSTTERGNSIKYTPPTSGTVYKLESEKPAIFSFNSFPSSPTTHQIPILNLNQNIYTTEASYDQKIRNRSRVKFSYEPSSTTEKNYAVWNNRNNNQSSESTANKSIARKPIFKFIYNPEPTSTTSTERIQFVPSTSSSTTEKHIVLNDTKPSNNRFSYYTNPSSTEEISLKFSTSSTEHPDYVDNNRHSNRQVYVKYNYNKPISSTTQVSSSTSTTEQPDYVDNDRHSNRQVYTRYNYNKPLSSTEQVSSSTSTTEQPDYVDNDRHSNRQVYTQYNYNKPLLSTEQVSSSTSTTDQSEYVENDRNTNRHFYSKYNNKPVSSTEEASSSRSTTEQSDYAEYDRNSNRHFYSKYNNNKPVSSTEETSSSTSTTEQSDFVENDRNSNRHFYSKYNNKPISSTEQVSSSTEKLEITSSQYEDVRSTTTRSGSLFANSGFKAKLAEKMKQESVSEEVDVLVPDRVTDKYRFIDNSDRNSDNENVRTKTELFENRNTKPFRATAELPSVSEILVTEDERTKTKPIGDSAPTFKPKPIVQSTDLRSNPTMKNRTMTVTAAADLSRNVTIPARLSRVNTAIKSLTAFGGTRRNSQTPKCNENQSTPDTKCNEILKQRTSTRGRGSAHYTSAGEGDNLTVNRGTPATPRARPTLKPSTSIVSKATEFVDIYRYPPQRPDAIYPQPQVDKTAAKCRKDVCLLPDCSCGGKEIPGDIPVEEVPQIVLLTFDDAVNDLNKGIYTELFEFGRTNPNGCPISASFYVSHEWTDYSQVQNLYADGHELASHTVSHSFGEQFSQKKWNREVSGQREILAAYGGVHLEDVRGMRAPFLSVGGNKMFKMLYDSNFTYDSSLPVYENRPPSWPYTLDYKLFHDCMIPPCPTRSYPGVWEVPMVMWQDLNGGRCSMGDACSNPPDADGVQKVLMKNFERHYTTNRAPFGLFYHAAWFTQPHHKEGFIRFLDYLVSKDDVFLVTNWQAIQWVRDPTPLNRIKNFQPFQCNYSDRPKRCNNPKVCNLWHKSGVRYMKTCQPCPDIYPWTGKTGIRSSRIDNDIED